MTDFNPLLKKVMLGDYNHLTQAEVDLISLLSLMCQAIVNLEKPQVTSAFPPLPLRVELTTGEIVELPTVTPPASEPSSVATTDGTAQKPLESPPVSQDWMPLPSALMELISDSYKLTGSIAPELEGIWLDSSTLQLTLRWPTPSGSIKAGDRGLANPEPADFTENIKAVSEGMRWSAGGSAMSPEHGATQGKVVGATAEAAPEDATSAVASAPASPPAEQEQRWRAEKPTGIHEPSGWHIVDYGSGMREVRAYTLLREDADLIVSALEAQVRAGEQDAVREDYPFRCDDCGRAHILDTVIPSPLWNQIAPDGGMLCMVCIDRRLQEHGLEAEARFYYAGKALRSELFPDEAAPPAPAPCEHKWGEMQRDAYQFCRNDCGAMRFFGVVYLPATTGAGA